MQGRRHGQHRQDMPGLRRHRPAAVTAAQGWVLAAEVGIIALAYLVGLFRGPRP